VGKTLGATVIGTVGSEQKAEVARAHGCEHVILYRTEDVAARVRELTDGAGVPVVYDSVGAATFEGSLASLSRRGMLVSFGNASGAVPPVPPLRLSRGGSLYLTRPTLGDYTATPEELDACAASLFDVVLSGAVKVKIGDARPLAEARRAHEALEARETIGATLLIP
jgi:NADPH2:quinone reductase